MPESLAVLAQKEGNIWYFGFNAGLNFNGGKPVAVTTSAMSTPEGCSSIADANGKLLFYTDGIKAWNKNNVAMPNASGSNYPADWNKMLGGDASSTQSAMIAPVIGQPGRYYIFTVDGNTSSKTVGPENQYDGIYYCIVDMSLNGSLGDVDTAFVRAKLNFTGSSRNKIGLADSTSEKLCAVKHSCKKAYWVITNNPFTGNYYSYLVDTNGVSDTPVISAIETPSAFGVYSAAGYLSSSADGKTLVAAQHFGQAIDIFDFNAINGTLSKKENIPMGKGTYGVAFSPNDSVFYVSADYSCYQFQRFISTIASTQTNLLTTDYYGSEYALKLGPDNKIYGSIYNDTLTVINNPNSISNPQVNYLALPLKGKLAFLGLPNVFWSPGLAVDSAVLAPDAFSIDSISGCAPFTVKINNKGPAENTYSWDFGDGQNSTLYQPTKVYSEAGTYLITLTTEDGICNTVITANKSIQLVDTCKESATLYAPSAFSPNGDNVNDVFRITGSTLNQFKLQVFNRWGEKIFQSDDMNTAWNGKHNGNIVAEGVYVYSVEGIDTNGQVVSQVGRITCLTSR